MNNLATTLAVHRFFLPEEYVRHELGAHARGIRIASSIVSTHLVLRNESHFMATLFIVIVMVLLTKQPLQLVLS